MLSQRFAVSRIARSRASVLVMLTIGGLAIGTGSATASTVSVSGNVLAFVASPGEANHEHDLAEGNPRWGRGRFGSLGTPQDRLHPSHELARAERLRDVVVAPTPRPTSTSASASRAVRNSTGTGRSAWMRRHASIPSK